MNDVLRSEWLKLRSVRSSWSVPAVTVFAPALGALMAVLITAEFDRSSAELRATFAPADMSIVMLPLVQLAVGAVAALVITSEFGTGMIRPTLVSVPGRSVLFGAKALVVGAVALVTGLVASFGLYAVSWAAVGDRPAPIRPWESVESGLMTPVAGGIAVTVAALLALGLGAAIRSTAGTLVTVTVLIFVVPGMAALLPAPWDERVFAVSLLNLAPQLAGGADMVLSPLGAAIAAVTYAVIPLGMGAVSLKRRDA